MTTAPLKRKMFEPQQAKALARTIAKTMKADPSLTYADVAEVLNKEGVTRPNGAKWKGIAIGGFLSTWMPSLRKQKKRLGTRKTRRMKRKSPRPRVDKATPPSDEREQLALAHLILGSKLSSGVQRQVLSVIFAK